MDLDENIIASGYDKQPGSKWVAGLHDHWCTLCRCVEFGQGRDKGKHTSVQAAHEAATSVGFFLIGSGYFESCGSMPVDKWLDTQLLWFNVSLMLLGQRKIVCKSWISGRRQVCSLLGMALKSPWCEYIMYNFNFNSCAVWCKHRFKCQDQTHFMNSPIKKCFLSTACDAFTALHHADQIKITVNVC